MRRPIDSYKSISSTHGQKTNMGVFGRHLGIDYVVDVGTPVKAPVSGIITQSTKSASLGNYYEIKEDGNGRIHRLAHLSTRPLGVNARVSEGQEIAKSGNTGIVTGPHVHWDVRKPNTAWNASFDNYYNPEALLTPTPTPTPPASGHPYAGLVGKTIRLMPQVPTWSVYKPGTDTKLGTLLPKNNNGLNYIVRGVDSRKNRVLINSSTFGNGIALPLADASGKEYTGEWKVI